jgi:hypothetical protein
VLVSLFCSFFVFLLFSQYYISCCFSLLRLFQFLNLHIFIFYFRFCLFAFIFVAAFVLLPLFQSAKSELNLEDYSVNQTSLEQIFLRIAATKDDEKSKEKDVAPSAGDPVLVQPPAEARPCGSGARVEASDAAAAAPAADPAAVAGSPAVTQDTVSAPNGKVVHITHITPV